jgi:hypothetical protein
MLKRKIHALLCIECALPILGIFYWISSSFVSGRVQNDHRMALIFPIDFGKSRNRERECVMGGSGSGERISKKRTVESCRTIDAVTLKKWNLLVPGMRDYRGWFQWRRENETQPNMRVSYSLTVDDSTGELRLLNSLSEQNATPDYSIKLVPTPCHLGGVRWWFICPLVANGVICDRRVRKLYFGGKYFGCRHCHNLTYKSQQKSDSRVYALARIGLTNMPAASGASIAQLGVMLGAMNIIQKRLDRRKP